MSAKSVRKRILRELEAHLEAERLGLRDLTRRLAPGEMRLLRGAPEDESAWTSETLDRMEALVALGESRRPKPRTREYGRVATPAIKVLLIGFPAAERRQLSTDLSEAPDARFVVRPAESVEYARSLASKDAFDVALLNLVPGEESGAAQLARAEVATNGIPILAVAGREHRATLGELGTDHVLWKDELAPEAIAHAIDRGIEQRTSVEPGPASEREDPEKTAVVRDAITGLPNEVGLHEHLERALHHAERQHEQVAVLHLDIERFEDLESRLGRDVAESLLITAADRLRGALRRSDVLARIRDGEFLALLQGRELDYAPARTAERMIECLARAFVVDGVEHDMTASIGISLYPRDATGLEPLLRHARYALATARAAGRNCYRFYGHTESASEARRHQIAERLRGALDRGNLRVHYQPRVDGRDGSIKGVEALLRWTDEKLGDVSPAEFVPIGERSGLMCEIGTWVMREACRAHARWRDAGFTDLRLSVNVSAHQVQSASLRDAIVDAMMETKLAPGRLEIELTETALVDNQDTAAKLFRELAEIGVSLSLDDFGTGHSALAYVRIFPVRTLKIDPSFVREIDEEEGCPPFVNAILALASALDLQVVAEGVETAVQRDALLAQGCHEMQGFLYSPGVCEAELLDLLRTGTIRVRD